MTIVAALAAVQLAAVQQAAVRQAGGPVSLVSDRVVPAPAAASGSVPCCASNTAAAPAAIPAAPPGQETAALASSDAPAAGDPAADQGIVVSARRRHVAGDPLAAINARSYAVTQSVDRAVVGPIALGYRHVVPAPIRSGLHNLLYNLREPTVFVNFLLQLKPGKAAETLGRFAINSTVGIAGLIDVARAQPFRLPRRPNGFADSFGFYGVKPGPYMFLPLVGPTTLRDLIGGGLDRLLLPLAVGRPFTRPAYTIPTGVVSSLDHRVEIDDRLQRIRSADDPYVSMRSDYLRRRREEIDGLKGRPAPAPAAAGRNGPTAPDSAAVRPGGP